jgi:hypothetical protein
VSALAIHHLTDDEKRILFMRVHKTLVPGGVFVISLSGCGQPGSPRLTASSRITASRSSSRSQNTASPAAIIRSRTDTTSSRDGVGASASGNGIPSCARDNH